MYVLTNYDSTIEQDLYRIYNLRDLGFDPYVMIYNKKSADKIHRDMARWVNNHFIWRAQNNFRIITDRRHRYET